MELQQLFTQFYLDEIAKLPPEIAALATKYPSEIVNVIDTWNDEPFDDGYQPKRVEIYYGKAESAHVCIEDGILQDYNPPEIDGTPLSISVLFDANFVYIEIEGREIINKLGGAKLPEVRIDSSTLINMLTKGISDK